MEALTLTDTDKRDLTWIGISEAKLQLFLAAYNGDVKHTAKLTKISQTAIKKLLATVFGMRLLKQRNDLIADVLIADRQEREIYLTQNMRDECLQDKDRIRSCEVLGKMAGDFIERKEIDTKHTFIIQSGIGRTPGQQALEDAVEEVIDVSSDT